MKPKKKTPPHAAAPSPWKPPPATFTRPSVDDRLLEMFHLVQGSSHKLGLLELRLERSQEHVRAIALLAEARELLRAVVKLAPPVPEPKRGDGYPLTLKWPGFPLELALAAGELLPQVNELLKGAQR